MQGKSSRTGWEALYATRKLCFFATMNPQITRLAHGEISGPIVVGSLRPGVASGIGAVDTRVWLSLETLIKQRAHHPEIGLDFYADLSWLFPKGLLLRNRRPNCHILVGSYEDGKDLWKTTIKVVRANKRVMMLSVHRISQSDLRRLVKRSNG